MEFYQNMERDLEEAFQGNSPQGDRIEHPHNFVEENEMRQMNPVLPEQIDSVFGRELAQERVTMLTCKQWLLWCKLKCLSDLRAPHLAAMITELYIYFLQKYQISLNLPEIIRTMMMLQTCHLLTQALKGEVEHSMGGVSDIQQRAFYSTLSRMYFQEKQYLIKAVELLYRAKPLPMCQQLEQSHDMLSRLADSQVRSREFATRG